ncbi:hypothetical protein M758_4G099000 [Ceratodon purpureus]|nr:hypothetical protein M758_4G099000 [Ceratodon purpureus]
MATWALNALSGGQVVVLERVKIGHSIGAGGCRGLLVRRRLGSSGQSQFFGRQQLRGRVEAAFCVDHGQGYSRSRQLRGAYTTTEKIVGGLQQQKKESGKRRLILLRHAKSSWADRSLKDHNRPLSKKGRSAAANIATKLEKHSWVPELILCSDSLRTRETLEIMQAQYNDLSDAEVRFLGSFYSVAAMDGQTAQHIQENVLKYCQDDITTIMCMGHNRGWEEAASQLCGVAVELKTANAALLEAPGGSWKEAFEKAGMGGWKLVGIMKPDSTSDVEYEIA